MFVTEAFAATDGAAAEGGTFPPFDPTYFASQLLWLAITFGVFYIIMSRVVIPRLAGILESRHDRITRDLDETQRLKAEADAAHAAHENELAEAKRNAHAIALEATDKAKREAAGEREKVEAELATKLADAETRIAGIKQSAMTKVGDIAAETTQEIVKLFIGGSLTKAEVAKAIDVSAK